MGISGVGQTTPIDDRAFSGISGFAKNQAIFAHGYNVQNTGGALSVFILLLLVSFILPKGEMEIMKVSCQSNAVGGTSSNKVEDEIAVK
ncbi:hypothetical protein Dsin_011848 [Dipteronia sinensis]|uniref:Uncharacterized protein n=1 Tax=Dipteronia sinensis TaxID=43782 RepID=A0AAE0AHD9_9ROSI|nr:hypothetical protein Dsin_011848 [Dipteronia sinensis]